MLKRFLLIFISVIALTVVAAAATLYWFVAIDPGEAIRQASIEKILSVESPVFYRDGKTKLGVFFEETHRQYVPYRQIPKPFVNAIVAAEDHEFFHHYGVDFWGMVRAMVANIRAGRIVQGGSTLTQQAAKNLFKRRDRSVRAKLKELLYALRLEYRYPKSKILEFYANQFYVSGNGRGLGVAAHYYFDKPVEDLDVLECAFIAGSVKSPNTYNPFVKRDDLAAARARMLAKRRTGYVLEQMYKLGMIDPALYQTSIRREIPFRQGKMSYSLNTVMDLVKDALDSPQVQNALAEHGIANVATSGVRIYTTVEHELQEQGVRDLRQELSRLDVRLRGYDRETVQKEYAALDLDRKNRNLEPDGFFFGRVAEVDHAAPAVTVSFGPVGSEEKGRIDAAGLMNLAEPLARYRRNRWVQAGPADVRKLLKELHKDDLVFVHIRDVDTVNSALILDLEKYPKLEGGLLVVKDGTIRTMVGGFENHFFNRAVSAKRPMGSVIKPLVYCAALQLDWNSLDTLNNQRDVFDYQKQAYFPRPDHESPYARVSMSWAGVHSENLATIWLLYHLCDRLTPAQFNEVVDRLGLGRKSGESYQYYLRRIRDDLGVLVDQEALQQVAFSRAVAKMEPDLLFDGRTDEYVFLHQLHYGNGFDDYEEQLAAEKEKIDPKKRRELEEMELRRELLQNNYLHFIELRAGLGQLQQELAGGPGGEVAAYTIEAWVFRDRVSGRIFYGETPPDDQWEPLSRQELAEMLWPLDGGAVKRFWGEVLLEGKIRVATLDQLTADMAQEYDELRLLPAYGPEVLHQVPDFRVLVGLRYLIGLCRQLGIESKLDPVLSFPLGSNVISLLEVARAYGTVAEGSAFRNDRDEVGDAIAIIDRVETSDGELIFAPRRVIHRVVAPQTSVTVCDIMRNVVRFGTGRYADRNVFLSSRDPDKAKQLNELRIKWPVLGKTGTANRYTNAAFAGVVPQVDVAHNSATPAGGYVVTAYVGFDDNAPMVRTSSHITGSSGALPLWTELAKSIILDRDYAGKMDVVDFYFSPISEVPLVYGDLGQIKVTVDRAAGGTVADGKAQEPAAVVTFGTATPEGVEPTRFFLPYWRVGENGS